MHTVTKITQHLSPAKPNTTNTNNHNHNNDSNTRKTGVDIRPFRGYHPPKELMQAVASPPYDVLSKEEAKHMVTHPTPNEQSFLNVNKPEIHFDFDDPNFSQYADQVYQMGRKQLLKFMLNQWLVRDDAPCLYIYSQKMGEHLQFGLMCEASALQYAQNIIKRHENTRQIKEADRTKLTEVQSANVGPIFLCYKNVDAINAKIAEWVHEHAFFSRFTSDDHIEHTLWMIDDADFQRELCRLFETRVPQCYVADGHHRTASAYNVYTKRRAQLEQRNVYTGHEAFNYFLAVLFPDDQIQILDYNRTIHNIFKPSVFGAQKNSFESIDAFFQVLRGENGSWDLQALTADESATDELLRANMRQHMFRMYVGANRTWYALSLRASVVQALESDESTDIVHLLDTQMLTDFLLTPVLGIQDCRSSDNIAYHGGIHGLKFLESKVDENGIAIALYPTTMQQIIEVSDAGKLMPPKSTWFEPKLRSGVVVRTF